MTEKNIKKLLVEQIKDDFARLYNHLEELLKTIN